jgi:SWI/SNF-related matrix-associated actin-dependent regulator 1 of chromatin subfamily A
MKQIGLAFVKSQEVLKITFKANKDEFFQIMAFVKTLSKRWFDANKKCWYAEISDSNITQLLKNDFEIDDSLLFYLKEKEEKKRKRLSFALTKEQKNKIKKLYPFQKEGIEFIFKTGGNCLIADEMGLGKTIQAIGYLKLKKEYPALIICPASLKYNWQKEIKKWLNKSSIIINGKKIYKIKKSTIYIINYDILHTWVKLLKEIKFGIIIADEIQYIKNEQAKRTKAFVSLVRSINSKIFLSGTPIKNKPAEFFTSLNLLSPKVFDKKWDFLYRYCNPIKTYFGWTFDGATNLDELFCKIQDIMIRRKKIDVLNELPEKRDILIDLSVDLSLYAKYEKEYSQYKLWNRDDKEIHKNAIEKLKQLAYKAKHKYVIKWIKDFIDITDKKLVIFAYHRKVIDSIMSEFEDISVKIDGSVSLEERNKNVELFQNDEKIKLFVGQIIAAGSGLTLTASSTVCFIEFGWSPCDHEQAACRVHRIGQKANSIDIYYLIANSTIEKEIVKLLQEKSKNINQILDGEDNGLFKDDIYTKLMEILN